MPTPQRPSTASITACTSSAPVTIGSRISSAPPEIAASTSSGVPGPKPLTLQSTGAVVAARTRSRSSAVSALTSVSLPAWRSRFPRCSQSTTKPSTPPSVAARTTQGSVAKRNRPKSLIDFNTVGFRDGSLSRASKSDVHGRTGAGRGSGRVRRPPAAREPARRRRRGAGPGAAGRQRAARRSQARCRPCRSTCATRRPPWMRSATSRRARSSTSRGRVTTATPKARPPIISRPSRTCSAARPPPAAPASSNSGSPLEYGDHPSPVAEDAPLRPTTPTGRPRPPRALSRSRATIRRGCAPWCYARSACTDRATGSDRLIPTAVRAALSGDELPLTPPGIGRDWVHVDDVARGCVLALGGGADGEAVNLGSGEIATNEQVVAHVSEALRAADPHRAYDADAPSLGFDGARRLSAQRRRRCWSGAPSVSLAEGIRATVRPDQERAREHHAPLGVAMTELSVVVPVYGNAADLPELHRRVSDGDRRLPDRAGARRRRLDRRLPRRDRAPGRRRRAGHGRRARAQRRPARGGDGGPAPGQRGVDRGHGRRPPGPARGDPPAARGGSRSAGSTSSSRVGAGATSRCRAWRARAPSSAPWRPAPAFPPMPACSSRPTGPRSSACSRSRARRRSWSR